MSGICYDSRQAQPGFAFVALRGAKMDGHDFIAGAIARGATTIVAEKEPGETPPEGVSLVIVSDTRDALARLAEYYYDFPSRRARLLGVTGTNGKTTITYLLASIVTQAGKKWGRIGTVGYDVMGKSYPSSNTTPESLDIQRMLAAVADGGGDYCFLEVSSHALDQRRVDRLLFRSAIFTNLTQDHLDYHGDMETYFNAKRLLFTRHAPEISVINVDDPWGERLLPAIGGKTLTYGLKKKADVTAADVLMTMNGVRMTLVTPHASIPIKTRLTGTHNVYNILAAAACAIGEGIGLSHIVNGIEKCVGAPGRFEKVVAGQPFAVIVDYAHTEDALINVLGAARGLNPNRIITLFGCGGDRDKLKRPLMGRAVWDRSEMVIVTSDNPRTENPQAIIDDVLKGIPAAGREGKLYVLPDREEAVAAAIRMARPGDLVLLAGKGHEDYQIIGEQKIHFDDREVAANVIKEIYGKV
jgi:UDP-N-acetylmuramoyl-L-alanyl-D-glutamate--2,6-diaminopimelate ligase